LPGRPHPPEKPGRPADERGVSGTRQGLGRRGEEVAARYLQARGYRIIARNLRTRLGELDLVALDGEAVVFVEVKTRRTDRAGGGAEAVDAAKRRRLLRLARAFVAARGLADRPCRFDVVALAVRPGRARIEVVRDAFGEGDRGG